jgi:hypothetical protein
MTEAEIRAGVLFGTIRRPENRSALKCDGWGSDRFIYKELQLELATASHFKMSSLTLSGFSSWGQWPALGIE